MITSHMNGYVQEVSGQAKSHRERAVDCPGEESSLVKSPNCSAHMERIQHYQEELRKRREEDGRGRHDIDPNASLRLKKLSQNPKVGIDNPTFEGKENASKDTSSQDPVVGELEGQHSKGYKVFQEVTEGGRRKEYYKRGGPQTSETNTRCEHKRSQNNVLRGGRAGDSGSGGVWCFLGAVHHFHWLMFRPNSGIKSKEPSQSPL